MVIDISKQELNLLYSKAEKSYYSCIQHEENAFLEEELPTLFTSVKLRHASVKVVFTAESTEEYIYEVILYLWDNDSKRVGEYVYREDNKGNEGEDSLVFY